MIPQIMGILNVTPDSFSDGGRYVDVDAAVARARHMIDEGADIVDVGGESTRPGAEPVTLDEELRRVVPVIEAVVPLGARVSVDTRHDEVARAAVAAGADLINDVSATLWPVAADTGAGWLAMHMQGTPGTMQAEPHYDDVCAEVREFLIDRATAARNGGVDEVWIDPGFGFGKTVAHNLALVAGIDGLVATGFPVALGVSRKHALGVLTAASDGTGDGAAAPVEDRVEMSVALATWAMMAGVQMIRAHDVRVHAEAARVVAARRAPIPAASAGR
ncbi:MAG: dihydropteroate synthase [Acidimicrobiales bacterium]